MIENSARLDLLWATAYLKSNDTKQMYASVELPTSNRRGFRRFPGAPLSEVAGTWFACDSPNEGESGCYDPINRPWYEAAVAADQNETTGLGDAVVIEPYLDAAGAEKEWLLALSRAVYADADPDGGVNSEGELLCVIGVDVMLEQMQLSIDQIDFSYGGYFILATAEEGRVLAAPSNLWDRDDATATTTVCELGNGICSNDAEGDGTGTTTDEAWQSLLERSTDGSVYEFTSSDGNNSILVAAAVTATFGNDGAAGETTHYVLSAVPRGDIYKSVEGMEELIRDSTKEILITTGAVAAVTLIAVGVAACMLSGTITRPIERMAAAAQSIADDGARTNVFGAAAKSWAGKHGGEDGGEERKRSIRTSMLEYLLCRGDDEIKTLGREFALMITGLGKRGSAARATGLETSTVYPKNPFTASHYARVPPTAPVSVVGPHVTAPVADENRGCG